MHEQQLLHIVQHVPAMPKHIMYTIQVKTSKSLQTLFRKSLPSSSSSSSHTLFHAGRTQHNNM